MQKLLWIIISLSMLWAGYWFVGSSALERGMESWLSDDTGRDWSSEYSALQTTGFPNRFDTTLHDLRIEDVGQSMAWSAPFLQIFALSYKPNHIIAIWPNRQTIEIGSGEIGAQVLDIKTDRMRGSVVFRPDTALTLDRSALEIANFALQSNLGWSMSARSGQFNSSVAPVQANTQDLVVQILGLRPSEKLLSRFNPQNQLPDELEALRLDASLAFDAPWDRHAIEGKRPGLTGVEIKRLQINWGELDFRATGNLGVDRAGFLEGKLDVKAQNWRGVYQLLLRMGVVQGNFIGAVEAVLQMMALETEGAQYLEAEWVFQGGRMRLGALPLGPAPRLLSR